MTDKTPDSSFSLRALSRCCFALACVTASQAVLKAEVADYDYRVLGLFQKDREDDLRKALEHLPGVVLVDVNYETGSATFRFESETAFPGAKKPEQILNQFDQKLRQASRGTFSLTAPTGIDRGKLAKVEIGVAGLDCKGCSYGAYLAVYQIEGVENAVASFHDGRVIAWIDAEKTKRETLEAALEKKGVSIVKPDDAGE